MKVIFIPGSSQDKALSKCYKYIKEKYMKEKLSSYESSICKSEHRGSSDEGLQPKGPAA